ncbi:dihydrodipicolinate synthase family protein [Antarcticibacterium flavum]|uniref:Dihydrodipicolinate synthase family protein n=1 Tax=Antarcticibacterium flavum TaxID=2058175 RepID=A0A5B7X7D6_9FLAO|nr:MULTISPECIES: dihydrodipicolinate synthase family protein [Antarcticibacterium]MCM4159688.1 dihydrodipicolinate synthase family protein [Antarcticibacterium sp. W02-3]QCY70628.1 dihydrodipicolinate synthase family protein [Antarcticibacterium flavum]
MKVNWNGVMPALTTKFTKEDTLDLQMFKTNLDTQLKAGVNGIILGGTLGEASTLTPEEKRELTRFAKEAVGDRVPVIMNVAEQTTKGAIRAVEIAEEDGASGIMILPPMRYRADERETVEFFRQTAKSTSLPLMIYNNPIDYKIEVTLDMFEQLLKEDNIQAVKESTRDITNVTRLINRFGDRLKVLTGVDTIAMESLVMGADGWVAGLVCAFPRESVAIYRLVKAGRIEEARKIFRWFLPVLELDIVPKLVQNIKLAEVATGIGTENVRAPRLQLEGEERQQVQKIIDDAVANRPVIEETVLQ